MTVLSTVAREEELPQPRGVRPNTLGSLAPGMRRLTAGNKRDNPYPRPSMGWNPKQVELMFSKVVLSEDPTKKFKFKPGQVEELKAHLLATVPPSIVPKLRLPSEIPNIRRTDTHWTGTLPPPYVPYFPLTLGAAFDPAYTYSQQTNCGSAFLSTQWYEGYSNIQPTDTLNMANKPPLQQYSYIFGHCRTARAKRIRITAQLNPAVSDLTLQSDHHLSFFGDNWAEGDPSWIVYFYNASWIQSLHVYNAMGEDMGYPGDMIAFWDTTEKLTARASNFSQVTSDGYSASAIGASEYYPFIPASDNTRQWTIELPGEGILCRQQDAIVCRTGKTTSVASQNQLRSLYMNVEFEFVDIPVDTREVQTYSTFEVFPA